MMEIIKNLKVLDVNVEQELTIALIVAALLVLAIVCLTIIKKLKDK